MKVVLAAAALVAVATPAYAQPPDVPRTVGFVVDGATAVPDDVERRIETRLRQHQRETTNEVVVMTVPTTGGIAIEQFAKQVFNTLGIGRKDRNNGVLIMLAMQDRKLRIQVGTGLEATITNAEAKAIVDGRMVPALKAGDPGRAVKAGVEGVLTELGDPAPLADDPPPDDAPPPADAPFGFPAPAPVEGVGLSGFSDAGDSFGTFFPVIMLGAVGIIGAAIVRMISGVTSGISNGAGYHRPVWFGRHNTSWADEPARSFTSSSGSSSFGSGSSSSSSSSLSSSGFGGGSTSGGGASGSW